MSTRHGIWLGEGRSEDIEHAGTYLRLLTVPSDAKRYRDELYKHRKRVEWYKITDIVHASGLAVLAGNNPHVAPELAKITDGELLAPILLVRGCWNRPLLIVDGWYRLCAAYWHDLDSEIPVVIA